MTSGGASGTSSDMMDLIRVLYPICRSITGDGVRATLREIAKHVGLDVHEVPSGTPVLDWTVPDEWNVRDAWIRNARGERVVDFRASNLHVLSYSEPVPPRRISREELEPHLFSLPDKPDWIPYRTSYYQRRWGFCVTENQRRSLTEPEYEVCIDSTLAPGSLTWAEHFWPGETSDEVLVSTHVCHPSLCNDNLSGIAVAVELAQRLARAPRRFGYRFLFVPGTIGAITWLHFNRERLGRVRAGLTLTCLGDDRPLTYKQSVFGDREIDRVAVHVLSERDPENRVVPFTPYGYDERQYNSPGFRLPVGSLMRGVHDRFPEYHTSADDLDFVRPERLEDAVDALAAIFDVLEADRRYRNLAPEGEPQLGRRGLYSALGAGGDPESEQMAMLWLLNLSDGGHSLLDVARRAELPFERVRRVADLLTTNGLLEEVQREEDEPR